MGRYREEKRKGQPRQVLPRRKWTNRDRQKSTSAARRARRKAAEAYALKLAGRIREMQAAGITSLGRIAHALTDARVRTAAHAGKRGRPSADQCQWTKSQVSRLLARVSLLATRKHRRFEKAAPPPDVVEAKSFARDWRKYVERPVQDEQRQERERARRERRGVEEDVLAELEE